MRYVLLDIYNDVINYSIDGSKPIMVDSVRNVILSLASQNVAPRSHTIVLQVRDPELFGEPPKCLSLARDLAREYIAGEIEVVLLEEQIWAPAGELYRGGTVGSYELGPFDPDKAIELASKGLGTQVYLKDDQLMFGFIEAHGRKAFRDPEFHTEDQDAADLDTILDARRDGNDDSEFCHREDLGQRCVTVNQLCDEYELNYLFS